MIYAHDEVELIDVLTLMEAVSKMAGRQITARMIADCHLAIKWFHELVDFSGNAEGQIKVAVEGVPVAWPMIPDWHWDGPVVMQSLESRGPRSLAWWIYMSRMLERKHVKAWIASHESWRLKPDG